MNAQQLAVAHPLSLDRHRTLGEAGLAADLRIVSDEGPNWARGWVVPVFEGRRALFTDPECVDERRPTPRALRGEPRNTARQGPPFWQFSDPPRSIPWYHRRFFTPSVRRSRRGRLAIIRALRRPSPLQQGEGHARSGQQGPFHLTRGGAPPSSTEPDRAGARPGAEHPTFSTRCPPRPSMTNTGDLMTIHEPLVATKAPRNDRTLLAAVRAGVRLIELGHSSLHRHMLAHPTIQGSG